MEKFGEEILDLSGQGMKKLPRQFSDETGVVKVLRLDNNELQKLELLTGYTNITEFTASGNQLLRMYCVSPLKNLVRADFSCNKIICIEGLKDLIHLSYLNLSHNKIKEIDHLYNNLALEYIDLSDNLIGSITNMSQLSRLKKLFLHKNQIFSLKHAEVYLPKSLDTLTLATNKITDLNEVSRLVALNNLKEISIKPNPCLDMTGQSIGFDYRPFIVNWCLGIKVIDGFAVDELESLRGEWLYSQGKGRQFRLGEHTQLVQYLAENLPFNNEPLQTEQERKLRLILSKAHQHQSQLLSESPLTVKCSSSHLMSRSLDPSLLEEYKEKSSPPTHVLSRSLHCQSLPCERGKEEIPAPLPAASKLVPVPESLISPMVASVPEISADEESSKPSTADTDSFHSCEEISSYKLQTIKTKADEMRNRRTAVEREMAALCIQKNWRGYVCRNSSPEIRNAVRHLQMQRINQHVLRLSDEIKSIKLSVENGHRLHMLQMQAINGLWRKVQQLQLSMQQVLRSVAPSRSTSEHSVETQTDITAVHSPDDSSFVFNRPSSLSLSTHQVTQYAENLVGDVFKDTIEDHSSEAEQ